MKNQHKYFKNRRYRQRLKSRYCPYQKYLTKKPATNIEPYGCYLTDVLVSGIDAWHYKPSKSRYEYYSDIKPDVPYTILRTYWAHKSHSYKTWLKKYRNKQFRKRKNDFVSSKKAFYKKLYEYWWDIE